MLITPAFAQAAGGGDTNSMLMSLLPFALIFVIMYFLILRPQQKKVKDHAELVKNIRRGDTAEDLYQSRVSFVTERMMHCGVKLGPIEDGPPGGQGAPSERVLTVLERSYERQAPGGAAAGASTGSRNAGAKVRGSEQ